MDQLTVERALIQVLNEIQAAQPDPGPAITAATRPLEDLPGFDSKMWPAALSMVSAALGITLPLDENLFVAADDRRRLLTVREIAERIVRLAPGRGATTPAATAAATPTAAPPAHA